MVDKQWLERTKATSDPSPLIKAFRIAHEGNSNIQLDGILTPIKWVKSAIGWIHDKVLLHTPVFNEHGPPGDNSHDGRKPIGEIVGTRKDDGTVTATIAAMYIYPEFRDLDLDVASIEADFTYAREGNTVWPTGINKITGVALANSANAHPGFPDATILGSIAAFAKEDHVMNISEVKTAIGTLNVKPEDLFEADALTGSPAVRDFITQSTHDSQQHTRRVADENKKLETTLKAQYEGTISELRAKNLSFETGSTFANIVTERKLDDKSKAYVDLQLKHFRAESDDPVKFKEALNKYVDEQLENFKLLMPTLGIEIEKVQDDGDPKGDTKPPDIISDDNALDPDVNPLIPGGKADLEYDTKT